MRLPFTVDQFLDVFRRYNAAVWPAQVVLLALAAVALAYAMLGGARSARRVNAILALLWLWMAIAYHIAFLAAITRVAVVFAIAFAAQAALFAWFALGPRPLEYQPRVDAAGFAGAALVLYALVGYPALGVALAHRYPAAPTFGVPCPTTIFTFGLLLWCRGSVPWRVVVIPALWAVVGMSAAVNLGMTEDLGLPLAAVVTAGLMLAAMRDARWRPAISSPNAD